MKADGMNYAPRGQQKQVVEPGTFAFAAVALDHGHIYGMANGLTEAGATLKWVYDPDPKKVEAFQAAYPQVRVARSEAEVLEDPEIRLVAGAAVPNQRCALGLRVMEAGKDYFTDKTPMTTLAQLEEAKAACARTGQKYMVYFSERLHNESAVFAGQLIRDGAIGEVIQVLGLGPHRLNAPSRPDWFFDHEQYGGILCDIGSHQIEQYLFFAGVEDAQVTASQVGNFGHPDHPELEDFGDCNLLGANGSSLYFRVDWFTPDGLRSWGDGRTMVLGTKGTLELRKYLDVATDSAQGDHVIWVDGQREQRFCVAGQAGFPFFGELILDVIHRTEQAMTQSHVFKAAELCLKAQQFARVLR